MLAIGGGLFGLDISSMSAQLTNPAVSLNPTDQSLELAADTIVYQYLSQVSANASVTATAKGRRRLADVRRTHPAVRRPERNTARRHRCCDGKNCTHYRRRREKLTLSTTAWRFLRRSARQREHSLAVIDLPRTF